MSSSSIPPSTFYSRPTFNGIPKSQLVGSSGSSSTLGLGLPSGHTGGNGAGPSGTRKRSASPDLSMTTDGDGQRPNKQHRSTGSWNATNGSGLGPGAGAGSGSGFSRVKSEDDFARRGNTAVEQPRTGAVDGTGKEGEGSYRRDDTPGFIGRRYLREQLGKHCMSFGYALVYGLVLYTPLVRAHRSQMINTSAAMREAGLGAADHRGERYA